MSRGCVYLWTPDPERPAGGYVTTSVVPLERLENGSARTARLRGRFVVVRNGGAVNEPDPLSGGVRASRLGDAAPNADGDFLFEPGKGGGRLDKVALAEPDFRSRYVQAARFGEVNTYFHVDRIAAYVDGLLHKLGASSLPRVVAVVTAHSAVTEQDGLRDGVRRPSGRWFPFQGGHYRLPGRTSTTSTATILRGTRPTLPPMPDALRIDSAIVSPPSRKARVIIGLRRSSRLRTSGRGTGDMTSGFPTVATSARRRRCETTTLVPARTRTRTEPSGAPPCGSCARG